MVDVNNTCSIFLKTHQDGYMDPCGYFVQNNLIFKISTHVGKNAHLRYLGIVVKAGTLEPGHRLIPALKANALVWELPKW